jgi:hypothetical protein
MAKRTTLDAWIQDAMTDPDKERITRFTLVQMQGTGHLEIHTYKFASEKSSADPKQLANMFRGKAETYAQDLPGVQTFNLWAYYGKEEPEARQPFTVNVAIDPMAGGLYTEPPTDQGLTMQKMRQNEALMQQVYRRQQVQDEWVIRWAEMQSRENERLRREGIDREQIMLDMMRQNILNDHTMRMDALKYHRETEERKKWLQFAPALVNQLLGTEIFPQSTEDSALIEGIAEHISEDHLKMLGSLGIPDALLGPLAGRVQKALKAKREENETMRALPMYKGSGEDDVTGGAH